MKKLVSAISMVIILAAAPAAFARPAQPRERDGIVKMIRLAVQRLLGGIFVNGLPSPPIPKDSTEPEDSTQPTENGLPSQPIPEN